MSYVENVVFYIIDAFLILLVFLFFIVSGGLNSGLFDGQWFRFFNIVGFFLWFVSVCLSLFLFVFSIYMIKHKKRGFSLVLGLFLPSSWVVYHYWSICVTLSMRSS